MATLTNQLSSRQLMDEIVTRAAIELIQKLKVEHRNNENLIMRDIKSLHSNVTYEDLPEYLKKAVKETSAAMFGYMNKNNFVLVPKERK